MAVNIKWLAHGILNAIGNHLDRLDILNIGQKNDKFVAASPLARPAIQKVMLMVPPAGGIAVRGSNLTFQLLMLGLE